MPVNSLLLLFTCMVLQFNVGDDLFQLHKLDNSESKFIQHTKGQERRPDLSILSNDPDDSSYSFWVLHNFKAFSNLGKNSNG